METNSILFYGLIASVIMLVAFLAVILTMQSKIRDYKKRGRISEVWRALFMFQNSGHLTNLNDLEVNFKILIDSIGTDLISKLEIKTFKNYFFGLADEKLAKRVGDKMKLENSFVAEIRDDILSVDRADELYNGKYYYSRQCAQFFKSEEYQNGENIIALLEIYSHLCELCDVNYFSKPVGDNTELRLFEVKVKSNLLSVVEKTAKFLDLFGWEYSGCYHRQQSWIETVKSLSYINPEACSAYLDQLEKKITEDNNFQFNELPRFVTF